jgi:hypothetical protein
MLTYASYYMVIFIEMSLRILSNTFQNKQWNEENIFENIKYNEMKDTI